ncbi:MAG: RluA family pseudouridine synthase, partial [Clostridia bacterium]|nr:RluA family pseudouridine synthase [Clostridia bacterium]
MQKKITLKIDKNLCDSKIENILKRELGFSSTLISRLKRTVGGIMLNGKMAKTVTFLKEGDIIELTIPAGKSETVKAIKLPLDILYEDEDVIAVNKPCSMPTHPSGRHKEDTLINALGYYFKDTDYSIHVITRLDKDTSGVVLIAKNPLAARILTDSIKNREIKKEYLAVLNAAPTKKKGTLLLPIKKAEDKPLRRIVSPDGKEAVTSYEVLDAKGGFSLVKLVPVTGRTHQLRVHMSHIGHPIYGDSMYGAPQRDE